MQRRIEEFLELMPDMDMMRSEKMTFVQFIIPFECAHRAVSYLEDLGLVQFRDVLKLTSGHLVLLEDELVFQLHSCQLGRLFVWCAEMSRKLRFLREQINKAGVMLPDTPAVQSDIDLKELETQLGEHEHELIEMNSNSERLQQTYNELLEFKTVLQKAVGFLFSGKNHAVVEDRELDENVFSNNGYVETASLIGKEMRPSTSEQSGLNFISGIVCKSKVVMFERMFFRATRGNVLFNQPSTDGNFVDRVTSEEVEKIVFTVFFSGEQVKKKILKICQAFGDNCYSVPEDITKPRQMTTEVLSRLSDFEASLDAGLCHQNKVLRSIALQLPKWRNKVIREKAVYDMLNMLTFDVTKKMPSW